MPLVLNDAGLYQNLEILTSNYIFYQVSVKDRSVNSGEKEGYPSRELQTCMSGMVQTECH